MPYELTKQDLRALKSYATEFGLRWKDSLWTDWYNARTRSCDDMPDRGAVLHRLRNTVGPEWLHAFNLAQWDVLYAKAAE